jgi:thiamine biosynthesis protein ThiI
MVKVIALVSGGIDSAVASALALQQGMGLVMLHFDTKPLGNTRGIEKTEKLARHLALKFGKKIKVCVVPHGETLFEIARKCGRKYSCVLCRRMMLRVAEKVARREKASALLTGESLGQVASQTLFNLNAEHSAVKIPVMRPLLGMDKLEIEKLAKGFGTFETSILPSACCQIPVKPATKATGDIIAGEEKKLDIEKLAGNSLKGIKCQTIALNKRK